MRHLTYRVAKANREYQMIRPGDRVMVCHSGGKDSFALLETLQALLRQSPDKYEISILCIDINLPDFPVARLETFFETTGLPWTILNQDIIGTVKEKIPDKKNYCGLCSRLRRGAIYRFAEENGIDKIALGHHMDDIVETLFLNLFYGGKLKAMPPKLLTGNKKNIVIRPLSFIREKDIQKLADLKGYPIADSGFCDAVKNRQRVEIKEMMKTWQQQFPGRLEMIFRSICNVEPELLADNALFDLRSLEKS